MNRSIEISKEDMLRYLDARIQVSQNHVDWYKKQNSQTIYMTEELLLQKAIREVILKYEFPMPKKKLTPEQLADKWINELTNAGFTPDQMINIFRLAGEIYRERYSMNY